MIRISFTAASIVLALAVTAPTSVMADDKAPMPQTRGMQGMDPSLHDQWAKEGKQDPYKDCTPSSEKAAQMKEHPMPETKGMKGMDPKTHEVDCPEAPAAAVDPNAPPKHVHKSGTN